MSRDTTSEEERKGGEKACGKPSGDFYILFAIYTLYIS
jgi:hypothetical protein